MFLRDYQCHESSTECSIFVTDHRNQTMVNQQKRSQPPALPQRRRKTRVLLVRSEGASGKAFIAYDVALAAQVLNRAFSLQPLSSTVME